MQLNFSFSRKALTCLLCVFVINAQAQVPADTRGVTTTSLAATDTTKGDVYAIIMGVSKYPGITPLKYADKDAILFREFLKTPSGGNAKPENILCLINDSAKMADFYMGAHKWLQNKKLKKGDRLYFYFSGHGDAMEGGLYFFLPYDCEPNKDGNNYLGTGNINLQIVKTGFIKPQVMKGVEVLLIMDACRTNELPNGKEGQQNFVNNFIAEEKVGDIILLSTGAGQVSIESPTIGNGHGLFTWYLIDGLAGAADKDPMIGDNDGKVSLSEISSYLKGQVKKIARENFNTVQIPYYCCSDKDLSVISKVDGPTFTAWENSKKLQQLSSDQNLFAVARPGEKGGSGLSKNDTAQITIYNRFIDALKKERLVGESSAEAYYREMEKAWPKSTITEDARYSLATKYLNFCQQKINLFLSGKGIVHIMYMEKEINKEKRDNDKNGMSDLGEQIKRLKTLVTTGFDVAASMMEKTIDLLKDEPGLIDPYLPKLDFLKTMAAYSNKKVKLGEVVNYCRKAINSDPKAAAGYLLMGWIYQDMQDDSCEFYFSKAASLAPKWAYPMNGLGNYYTSKNNKKTALQYFYKAVQLDNLSGSAYRNIGMTYYNQKVYDSAKMYFKKAVDIDPCDSYANENYGSANADYISQDFGSVYTDSVYFNIARKFFTNSFRCDPNFASAYQKLSALYSRSKNEDSALAVLQRCTTINPENAEGFRNLGTYYLNNRKDTAKAEEYYKKSMVLDPSTGDNYYSLARLYRKQKDKQKAIDIYKMALDKIGNNKDLFNELGNAYFETPSDFETAISYYKKALQIDPTLAYVYFNLGKLYGVKEVTKDSSIFYFSKAVAYDPDRFFLLNHMIADFNYDYKKYSEAKEYYLQALLKNTFSKYSDVEKLVNIYITEKNFTEAGNVVNKYLNPQADKDLYTKLSADIAAAAIKN